MMMTMMIVIVYSIYDFAFFLLPSPSRTYGAQFVEMCLQFHFGENVCLACAMEIKEKKKTANTRSR